MKRTEGREESAPETQLRRQKFSFCTAERKQPWAETSSKDLAKVLADGEDWESTFNVLCAKE